LIGWLPGEEGYNPNGIRHNYKAKYKLVLKRQIIAMQ
jgi:hypothetical protein